MSKGKGFPGGGFGVVAETLGNAPHGPIADLKEVLAKAPTNPSSSATANPPQAIVPIHPVGGALAAFGTALSHPKEPASPKPAGNPLGGDSAALGTALTPAPNDTPDSKSSGNARPPDVPKQLGKGFGDALAALGTALTPSGTASAPPTGMQILTADEVVRCREYPDSISPVSAPIVMLPKETSVRVTCWTSASIAGASGKVQGSSVWLRTEGGCYIPEMKVQADTNFEKTLSTCEPVHHFVGTMQDQYKRQDCYDCTNTNCASKNMGAGNLIDLGCVTAGEATGGNS